MICRIIKEINLFVFLRSESKSHLPTFALAGTQDRIGPDPLAIPIATLANGWEGGVRVGTYVG